MNSEMRTSALHRAETPIHNTHAIHKTQPALPCIGKIGCNLQAQARSRKVRQCKKSSHGASRYTHPVAEAGLLPLLPGGRRGSGRGGPFLYGIAPLPCPLPARSSRGEGEDFWWV